MNEEIIAKYKKIIEYAKQMEVAITKNEWERVNLLISHREELIQQTGRFVAKNKPLDNDLKNEINRLIAEIKVLDNKNISLIESNRTVLEKDRQRLNIGQKALNAYQSSINKDSKYLDKKL